MLATKKRATRLGASGFDALETALLRLLPSSPGLASCARLELQIWIMFLCGWWFERHGEVDLVGANVRLSFHEPNAYKPMFGSEKHIRTLLTQVDDAEAFQRACSAR